MTDQKEWGLVRIDDRLIHGQVVAGWVRSRKFSKIHIVDDTVAADPFLVDVLRLSAPSDLQITAESFDASLQSLQQNENPQETMILLKSPTVALRLWEAGIHFESLNVGGIGNAPGRRKIFQDISLSPGEYKSLRQLYLNGVKIIFQSVPGEPSRDFLDLPEMK